MVISLESTRLFTGEATSGWLLRILSHFERVSLHQVVFLNYLLRKTGHFVGYAILSWLAFHGWMETLAYRTERAIQRAGKKAVVPRRWHLRAAVLAVVCTFVVACLDEIHQSFIPGRTGVFHDVVLDTMGGIFAQFILLLYWTVKEKRDRQRVDRASTVIASTE